MFKTKFRAVTGLLCFFMLLAFSAAAQENPLDRKVSISVKQTSVDEVLQQISEQYGVNFHYSSSLINGSRKIDLNVTGQLLEKVLQTIINNPDVQVSVKGNNIVLSKKQQQGSKGNFTISGFIADAANGEALAGTTVYEMASKSGTISNAYGFYSLTLPEGTYEIVFSFIGYKTEVQKVELFQNTSLRISLQPEQFLMDEVAVSAGRIEQRELVRKPQMSEINIKVEQLKNLPAIGGEVDILKVMQLMPGVQRGSEASTNWHVRGGDADQNLILLDEATVYNVSHLFGFFSVFNNDAIRDVTMYTGGFPAVYGGRLSSITDIKMKEGNMKEYQVVGGIGLLSSRVMVEGPIIKDKSSFMVSGRRSYIDKVLALVNLPVPYHFYDLNAKANYVVSDKDRLYFSSYLGNDVLKMPKEAREIFDFGFSLGNFTSTLRWNRVLNEKKFVNYSMIHTRFKYDVNGNFFDNSILIRSKISDYSLKADYHYYPDARRTIKYGGSLINHQFRPNVISTQGVITELLKSQEGKRMFTQEAGAYVQQETRHTDKFSSNIGLRLTAANAPGKIYAGPEPRLTFAYAFNDIHSVKAGLTRMYQYMHLVSSSSAALPTDLWYPVTKNIKPQHADQVSAGYNLFLNPLKSVLTIEGYYKRMQNQIEYREGAVLILNDNYEDELVKGRGWSYGGEMFLHKKEGKFNGWVSYSLSWSFRKFDELNRGEVYPTRYDRRHYLSVVGNYELTKRLSVSAIYAYNSGARFTPPVAQFIMPSPLFNDIEFIPVYTSKNEIKLSPAQRVDINFTIKNKDWKSISTEWQLGLYNVFNQLQPHRVSVNMNSDGELRYQETGIFGTLVNVGYNFKF